MRWQDHIEQNPAVLLGKPVIKGTRITVELLLERFAGGWTEQQIIAAYPHLKVEHIRAALAYAASSLASDETIMVAETAL